MRYEAVSAQLGRTFSPAAWNGWRGEVLMNTANPRLELQLLQDLSGKLGVDVATVQQLKADLKSRAGPRNPPEERTTEGGRAVYKAP